MMGNAAKRKMAVVFVSGDEDIEKQISDVCPSVEIWRLTEKLEARVSQLLETELYGNTMADVCGELICRGIEAAIAKRIIG